MRARGAIAAKASTRAGVRIDPAELRSAVQSRASSESTVYSPVTAGGGAITTPIRPCGAGIQPRMKKKT